MQAVYAYQRAGLVRERDVAEAYSLREQARQQSIGSDGDNTERICAFRRAAAAFASAAEAAAKPKEATAYYRICAQCYAESGNSALAGQFYERAREYTLSAQHYRDGGSFDDAVRLTKSYEQQIEPAIVEKIVGISKLYYLQKGHLR